MYLLYAPSRSDVQLQHYTRTLFKGAGLGGGGSALLYADAMTVVCKCCRACSSLHAMHDRVQPLNLHHALSQHSTLSRRSPMHTPLCKHTHIHAHARTHTPQALRSPLQHAEPRSGWQDSVRASTYTNLTYYLIGVLGRGVRVCVY